MERNPAEPNSPKISLIVPVYNTEASLSACVESLINQTYRNLELIFVDDGSTDGSPKLLEAYARKDDRIRVIRQANGGVSAARNAGIDAATGAFVGFVDSDDRAEPDYCETLLSAFSEHPEIGVSIVNRFIHGHPNGQTTGGALGAGRVLSAREAAYLAVSIGKSFEGYLWNKLFRAVLFCEAPRFRLDPSVSICEDLLLCMEIFASGQRAYYADSPVYHYNYRETGALRTFDEKRMSEFAARDRIERIAASFDEALLHAAELSRVKSALNLLYEAKLRHDAPTAAKLRRMIDPYLKRLVFARDLPLSERMKLPVRRAFPVRSMRAYRKNRRNGS